MATTNTGNSRSKDEKPKFKSDRPHGERKEFKNFKGKGNYNKEGKENREEKGKGDFKGKPDFNKSKGGGYNNRNFDRNAGFGKDKDEDDKPVRRPKQTKSDKPKEQQPDKMDIINRLEKEKKAMKKKREEKKEKPVKHQTRPKRSGNVDWTREYENDSYDDDDLDMYFR